MNRIIINEYMLVCLCVVCLYVFVYATGRSFIGIYGIEQHWDMIHSIPTLHYILSYSTNNHYLILCLFYIGLDWSSNNNTPHIIVHPSFPLLLIFLPFKIKIKSNQITSHPSLRREDFPNISCPCRSVLFLLSSVYCFVLFQ